MVCFYRTIKVYAGYKSMGHGLNTDLQSRLKGVMMDKWANNISFNKFLIYIYYINNSTIVPGNCYRACLNNAYPNNETTDKG